MSSASSRELLRSGKSVVGIVFMFVFLLGLMALIHLAINVQGPAPVVAVSTTTSQARAVLKELDARGIDVQAAGEVELGHGVTAVVSVTKSHALVKLAYPNPPAWIPIERVIESMGYSPTDITVVRQDGTVETDILRINLGTVLIAGFLAIVFLGLSVPIVSMRGRGTLRLLGTTPLSRLTFIVAQSPIRAILGIIEAAVIVLIAWTQGYASLVHSGRLAVTLVLGLAMLFSLGYLLASRSRNADLISQLCGLIPVLIILTSGTMLPLQGVPDTIVVLLRCFPTTWFIEAVSTDIAGTVPFANVYLLWAMMVCVTVGCTIFAAKIFRWDQTESPSRSRTRAYKSAGGDSEPAGLA